MSLSLVLGAEAGTLTAIPTSSQGLEDPSNSNVLRRSHEKSSRKGRQPLRDTDHGLLENGGVRPHSLTYSRISTF